MQLLIFFSQLTIKYKNFIVISYIMSIHMLIARNNKN